MKFIKRECLADDEICDIYEGIQQISKVKVKALKQVFQTIIRTDAEEQEADSLFYSRQCMGHSEE